VKCLQCLKSLFLKNIGLTELIQLFGAQMSGKLCSKHIDSSVFRMMFNKYNRNTEFYEIYNNWRPLENLNRGLFIIMVSLWSIKKCEHLFEAHKKLKFVFKRKWESMHARYILWTPWVKLQISGRFSWGYNFSFGCVLHVAITTFSAVSNSLNIVFTHSKQKLFINNISASF
jgi:hypothetical protein